MKILNVKQIREADAYTIKNEPIASIDLMERAARQCTKWISEKYNTTRPIVIIAGPGNNGGDGFAIARQLHELDYNVSVFIPEGVSKFSEDANVNLTRLQKTGVKVQYVSPASFPSLPANALLIDALFGSGLSRSLDGEFKALVQHINTSGNTIIAIDIPSGLFAEDNSTNDTNAIIKANYTLSFQFPKRVFFLSDMAQFTGKWKIVSIGLHPNFIAETRTEYHFLSKNDMKSILKDREKFTHKGTYGHGLLIAGCYGMFGAAMLASKAALRAGIGLLTCHLPRDGYHILQTALPEALVSIDESDVVFTEHPPLTKYNAAAIGPGLGTKANTIKAVSNFLKEVSFPVVIDADAINIIALRQELIKSIPENSILTPHPKEFSRLAGNAKSSYHQVQLAKDFAVTNHVYLILKGAHTVIATPSGDCWFNTTGNPGMATAGSGDVLTGVLLGLLSQGYSPLDASKISVYCHGLAGDLYTKKKAEESLIASDLIENLGKSFKHVRSKKI